MVIKALLKTSSTSYSQFLDAKETLHCWSEVKNPSMETDFFNRSVTLHYQHLYARKKWQSLFYRTIFFGFSFLFILLGIMIFLKTTNPICSLYFGNCSVIKNCVNFLCILLATGSFTLGYKIHPEKEAIKHLVKKVESELNAPAKQIQIEFNAILANLSSHWIEPHHAERL